MEIVLLLPLAFMITFFILGTVLDYFYVEIRTETLVAISITIPCTVFYFLI
jgi:hypothetical protein